MHFKGWQGYVEILSDYPCNPSRDSPSPNKLLTYVEYRAVSGVFQNIDPPPPLHPASEVHTRRVVRGWGVNILEDARHRIGLFQYNLSMPHPNTVPSLPLPTSISCLHSDNFGRFLRQLAFAEVSALLYAFHPLTPAVATAVILFPHRLAVIHVSFIQRLLS